MRYLLLMLFLLKKTGWDKEVCTFAKGVCLKVNIIIQLEFELTYFETTVQHFSRYAKRIPPLFQRRYRHKYYLSLLNIRMFKK